jgi:hypothetical protein
MLLNPRCPSLWASFGLNSEFVEKVTYEEIMFLQHRGKFSFTEAYNLPVALRKWFVERNLERLKEMNEEE